MSSSQVSVDLNEVRLRIMESELKTMISFYNQIVESIPNMKKWIWFRNSGSTFETLRRWNRKAAGIFTTGKKRKNQKQHLKKV